MVHEHDIMRPIGRPTINKTDFDSTQSVRNLDVCFLKKLKETISEEKNVVNGAHQCYWKQGCRKIGDICDFGLLHARIA